MKQVNWLDAAVVIGSWCDHALRVFTKTLDWCWKVSVQTPQPWAWMLVHDNPGCSPDTDTVNCQGLGLTSFVTPITRLHNQKNKLKTRSGKNHLRACNFWLAEEYKLVCCVIFLKCREEKVRVSLCTVHVDDGRNFPLNKGLSYCWWN